MGVHISKQKSLRDVLHLSRKIILANLKIWCSKWLPFLRNQRPDLQYVWWNCLSYCACHRFWNWRETLTFCSFLARCWIHCPCHTKPHPNFKSGPRLLRFLTCERAVRRTGVHFLNSPSSTSAPRCSRHDMFLPIHFEICFAPSRVQFWSLIRPQFKSGTPKHSKDAVFRDLSTFSCCLIFFLLTLSSLSLSSDAFSSYWFPFCFFLFTDCSHNCYCISPKVGSLTSIFSSVI